MRGLISELRYPNHVRKSAISIDVLQELQVLTITSLTKNGNQQITNAPIINPNVDAALRSREPEIRGPW